MICRFCGRKIDSLDKCRDCLMETPILLEYESYKGDAIVERLSQVLKSLSTRENIPLNGLNVLVQTDGPTCADISEHSENHISDNCEEKATIESGDITKETTSATNKNPGCELISNTPSNDSCDATGDTIASDNENKSVSASAEVSEEQSSDVQNERFLQTDVINTNEENIESNAVELNAESPTVKDIPNKKKVISIIAAVTAVLMLFGAGYLLLMTNRSNKEEQSSDNSVVMSESMTTEISTEELIATLTQEETTETKNIEFQATSTSENFETETIEIQTESTSESFEAQTDDTEIVGTYYGISDSAYSENSKDIFINIFGYKPIECSNEISVNEWNLIHNYSYVNYELENETLILDRSFTEIDDGFTEAFNFNEITQSENYENLYGISNEFYVFEVEDTKVSSTILCNKLNGLSYSTLPVEELNNLNYECLLSISNDEKDSIALYKNTYGKTSLKTVYRDSLSDIDSGSGDVVVSRPGDGYEIVRITLDGEKYIYFYRLYDSTDVYMIQYIRYNTLSNGVQDAILRDEEGEMVE